MKGILSPLSHLQQIGPGDLFIEHNFITEKNHREVVTGQRLSDGVDLIFHSTKMLVKI